jgi:hypothetical protein
VRIELHVSNFKEWARAGGPINPIWAKETADLKRELHRAQCRAARRIFESKQESSTRCLGAFQVYRQQRAWTNRLNIEEGEYQLRHLEELVACNSVGKFERFADQDIAFVCDFCDGYIVWPDLEGMPSMRSADETATSPVSPISPTTSTPNWQATGFSMAAREQKDVVFAPLAIANHIAPQGGDFVARLLCPFCEGVYSYAQGDDEMEEIRYAQDESGFEDLQALQEHLEWQHTPSQLPVSIPSLSTTTSNCVIM